MISTPLIINYIKIKRLIKSNFSRDTFHNFDRCLNDDHFHTPFIRISNFNLSTGNNTILTYY